MKKAVVALHGCCRIECSQTVTHLSTGEYFLTAEDEFSIMAADCNACDVMLNAVYFETTLEGAMRDGHLWEHSHGKAVPAVERV